jgi:hypothetical protein
MEVRNVLCEGTFRAAPNEGEAAMSMQQMDQELRDAMDWLAAHARQAINEARARAEEAEERAREAEERAREAEQKAADAENALRELQRIL